MILYFSGTGNSQWVAQQLAESFQEPLYQMTDILRGVRDFCLSEKEALGFVFPVYAWGPPAVVLQLIASLDVKQIPSFIYFVCTCGDDTGKTADVFRRAIARRKWKCEAGYSVTMPNTYVCLPGFDVDPLQVECEKRRKASERVEDLKRRIALREKGFDCHEGNMPYLKTYVLRPCFNRFLMSSKKFHVSADCISCGLCERICPLQNIKVIGKPVWGNDCAMCLACYHHCPKHAIAYGKQTKGKGQYTFRKHI